MVCYDVFLKIRFSTLVCINYVPEGVRGTSRFTVVSCHPSVSWRSSLPYFVYAIFMFPPPFGVRGTSRFTVVSPSPKYHLASICPHPCPSVPNLVYAIFPSFSPMLQLKNYRRYTFVGHTLLGYLLVQFNHFAATGDYIRHVFTYASVVQATLQGSRGSLKSLKGLDFQNIFSIPQKGP